MEVLSDLLASVWNLFLMEFEIFGHSLSFAQIFAFTVVGDILLSIIGEVISGG